MSDVVRFLCPNLRCRAVLSVPQKARGRTVRCQLCQTKVKVPDAKKPREPHQAEPETRN